MNEQQPKACNGFARWLGKVVLRIGGWHTAGGPPASRNMVIIAAPHTTNWDFILLLAAAYSFGISVNWLGKDSLFRMPLGPLLRYLGGVPVDRTKANNLVDELAAYIEASDGVNLVVPPAGTRHKTDHWKSGFYRIAEAAQIPIVCGYLDYAKKQAGLGDVFIPSDMHKDMDHLRSFYGPITGRYPDKKSDIRLREED